MFYKSNMSKENLKLLVNGWPVCLYSSFTVRVLQCWRLGNHLKAASTKLLTATKARSKQKQFLSSAEKSHQPNLACTGLADKATPSFLLVKASGKFSFRFNQLQSSANTTKANTVEF